MTEVQGWIIIGLLIAIGLMITNAEHALKQIREELKLDSLVYLREMRNSLHAIESRGVKTQNDPEVSARL